MGVVTVLAGIGFISLALSGLLVVNTISSLLAQQQRQIGMMKAVGAQGNQIVGIYLSMTLAFGILALFVALPMGLALGYGFALTIANYLNFDVAIFNIPPWVIVMEIAAALVAPVISALVPILGGTRTTVREALHSYGISHTSKPGLLDRVLARIRGIPRPTLLSLRNTFRRKSRLWLTLGTLTFAGATFISVVNTRGSMIAELNVVLDLFQYDVEVYLDNAYPLQQIERKALEVPGVAHAEGWTFARVQRIRPDGEEGPTFSILAPPSGSPFLKPTIQEGRWLEPADENAIVLSSPILEVEPDIHAGDLIMLNINGIRREVEVVGILSSFGQNYLAYSNFDYLSRTLKASGQTFAVFVGTQNHDMQSQQQVADTLEERFKDQGIGISQISTMGQTIQANIGQIDFLVYFLMFLALLIAVVGGLGLTGTMSLNVLERTREIGVMRAIGANNGSVRGIVVTEGVVIGVLSWVLSIVLSIPLTYGLASGVGIAVFQRPAMFTFSPVGVIVWLGLVIVIASAASLVPARRAVQISVREALAYE
jgi:putative ABC transport system permease protein